MAAGFPFRDRALTTVGAGAGRSGCHGSSGRGPDSAATAGAAAGQPAVRIAAAAGASAARRSRDYACCSWDRSFGEVVPASPLYEPTPGVSVPKKPGLSFCCFARAAIRAMPTNQALSVMELAAKLKKIVFGEGA